jgi:hypothetical protein
MTDNYIRILRVAIAQWARVATGFELANALRINQFCALDMTFTVTPTAQR